MIGANADYLMGVDPNGITKIDDLADSDNGAYVPARK